MNSTHDHSAAIFLRNSVNSTLEMYVSSETSPLAKNQFAPKEYGITIVIIQDFLSEETCVTNCV